MSGPREGEGERRAKANPDDGLGQPRLKSSSDVGKAESAPNAIQKGISVPHPVSFVASVPSLPSHSRLLAHPVGPSESQSWEHGRAKPLDLHLKRLEHVYLARTRRLH